MENWPDLVRGYLAADGWDVKTRGRDLLRGDRDSARGDDEKDYLYVWVPTDVGENFTSRTGPYLRRFGEASEEHPTAEKVFLVPTLEGLSSEFRQGARRSHGVKTLVPAQFFDSDFKWERDRRAASATSELRQRGETIARERIAQPFRVLQSPASNANASGSDLFDVLRDELRNRARGDDRPTIHLVVGPAGMGKSFLFESLYAHLYADFQADKRSQRLSARPFALLPEHLNDASAPTIGSLLEAYLRTEFARPLEREVFYWKLVNGMGIWLLDGLDEILERDSHFFDYDLMDLVTMPQGEMPRIVICVRDSLFDTHRGLTDFCEEFSKHVVVYQLSGWERSSKSDLARRKLGSRAAADSFTRSLSQHPVLDELAATPYYCELLTEEFASEGFGSEYSERHILERAIERIVARERGKGLLCNVSDDDVREFIESCAAVNLFEGGVPIEEVSELAEIILTGLDNDNEIERLVTQMGQIAVFAPGYDGRLRFAQEPLEHYLVAKYLVQSLQSRPEVLNRIDLPENVVRLMCDVVKASRTRDEVWGLLSERVRENSIFGRNALRIAVQLSAGTDLLTRVQLTGLDLSGLRFEEHDLRHASLDGADLTNTDFGNANLAGVSLENCLIKGTTFPAESDRVVNIRFGGMHKFYSARFGGRFFDDVTELRGFSTRMLMSRREDPFAKLLVSFSTYSENS